MKIDIVSDLEEQIDAVSERMHRDFISMTGPGKSEVFGMLIRAIAKELVLHHPRKEEEPVNRKESQMSELLVKVDLKLEVAEESDRTLVATNLERYLRSSISRGMGSYCSIDQGEIIPHSEGGFRILEAHVDEPREGKREPLGFLDRV